MTGRDGHAVTYGRIFAARVDRKGNLRLFQRRRFVGVRQVVFHPAREWWSFQIDEGGFTRVRLQEHDANA